jgi:hypothetical protein
MASPASMFPSYRIPRTQRFFDLLAELLQECAKHGQIEDSLDHGVWNTEIQKVKTTGRPSPKFKAILEAWLDPNKIDHSRMRIRPAVQELYDTLYPS